LFKQTEPALILRTGVNRAAKNHLIAGTRVWLPRRAKPRETVMTFEQMLKLIEECKAPHLRVFAILAISTGQRKTAILELTWDRVDFQKRTIDFRVDRDQNDILDSGGQKGRSVIDMGELAFHALSIAYRWRTCDHVIEYQGRQIVDVHQALKRAMRRAGITGKFFGAHAIRHSVATLIADQRIDLRMVQKMLGHQDFGTTDRIYAHHSRGYLEPAVAIVDVALSGIEPAKLADARSKEPTKGGDEAV
jgi:integrase